MTNDTTQTVFRCPIEQSTLKFGRFLFRWRSFIPLILIGWMLIEYDDYALVFGERSAELAYQFLCFGIVAAGAALRVLTTGYAGHATSGRNRSGQMADSLNTAGPYSIVRHPLYLANIVVIVGLAMKTFNLEVVAATIVSLVVIYIPIIFVEENYLNQKYGSDYAEWASTTPALFPRVSHWKTPENAFDWKRVFREEPDGIMSAVTVFVLVEAFRNYIIFGKPNAHPVWLGLWCFTTFCWLMLKFAKKKTSLLKSLQPST